MPANDSRESRAQEAERRRALQGSTVFENLGEPIQKLLLQVAKDVSEAEMKALSRVTVRQLAKVFDMLSVEEDPDKILAWLRKEMNKNDPDKVASAQHRQRVKTGAARDAVAFYQELEKKNIELMEKMKQSQNERDEHRAGNIAERKKRREQATKEAAERREREEKSGVKSTAVDKLKKVEIADIAGTFDRFASKQSTFDNSNASQDSEWWKQEEFRRDFEKNGRKGKLWTRVIQGGSSSAPDSEMAVREEWFRSQCWWKSDKYKRDWLASRDAAWWKEETYIRDWQDNGDKANMWTAADELSGFNRKGDRRRAAEAELEQRVKWYQNNGPKGIVKLWCALSENAADRCTLEEKREREDFFKNGDWWKTDEFALKRAGKELAANDALFVAGAAGVDREWWKDETYRQDFVKGGSTYRAISEKAAVKGEDLPATEAEVKNREDWYSDYWWKAEKFIEDHTKNGANGKQWKSKSEADSVSGSPKNCKDSEAKLREQWYQTSDDREWWKDECYLRDFQEQGNKGKKWTAGWQDAGEAATGDVDRAKPEELAKREEYFKKNWWKADKYIKDFQAHGSAGAAWKVGKSDTHEDGDWWKEGDYIKQWSAKKKNDAAPHWQDPKAIEDYWANGVDGKKWTAGNAAAASLNKGDAVQATPEDLAEREAFYQDNWWRSPDCQRDYAVNGRHGKKWTANDAQGNGKADNAELDSREKYFKSIPTPEYNAMFEADATKNVVTKPASAEEIAKREDYYKKNWWKAPEVKEDYMRNGEAGKIFKAATLEAAALDKSDEPQFQASPEEIEQRKKFFDKWWKGPEAREDFARNGEAGKVWKAANAEAAALGKGDDPQFQASPEELADRKKMFDNWWKAPAVREDYVRNGDDGKIWKAANLQAVAQGKGDDPKFQASADELADRKKMFDTWWTAPEVTEDFARNGEAGKVWKAANAEAAAQGKGDDPKFQASADELDQRKQWFDCDPEEEWWKDNEFEKEYTAAKEPEFWKSPEAIEDYVKNGANGKKWPASNAAVASMNAAQDPNGDNKADAAELKNREDWLKKNFWKAQSSEKDFLDNGEKGTIWTTDEPNGKGKTIPDAEMRSRAAYFKPTKAYQSESKPKDGTGADAKTKSCGLNEAQDREEWFEKNWWKSPEVAEDYKKNGKDSNLLKAATHDVAALGLESDPQYQASPEEVAERVEYFENCDDRDWWKDPAIIEDYQKNGAEGAKWQAGGSKEAEASMGREAPAPTDELKEREEWFDTNFWKSPSALEDYVENGNKGKLWNAAKLNADGTGEGTAPADEISKREEWFEAHKFVPTEEIEARKTWFQHQLTDDEKITRREWASKQQQESKKISADELGDVLTTLNDGQAPSDEQLKAIEEVVRKRRAELGYEEAHNEPVDAITEEEFVTAVAETDFYVPLTDEERNRAEEEQLEMLQAEEMARLQEEAEFVKLEAEEEREAAGEDWVDEAAAEEEEAMFLEEQEQALEAPPNEDDAQYTAEEEDAWNDYMNQQGEEDLTPEQQAELDAQEAERLEAESAREAAEADVWNQDDWQGEEDEAGEGEAVLEDDQKGEYEALVQEEGEDVEYEDEEYEEEGGEEVIEEVDELAQEEKGAPHQWKLPLREVTNPQFLKSYFTVIKYTPSHSFLGGKQKRVWVVDHFTRCFYNLEKSGKIKKEHAANKLLQLERNILDSNRLRLMFFDASHSYELQFQSPEERERFYESASAIRPSIRVYAPDLTNSDASVEACTTTIDGVGKEAVTVTCNNASGKPVARELTGECKINASKLLTEPLTIWTGTFNLSGHAPPRNKEELGNWMPKDKYDIYAVAVQEASYRKEESEWFEFIQSYLGKDYLSLASMNLWDTLLIVLCRKKHLLKITNVEGSTKATIHKSVCGTKGGIGISLRYLETSICFVTAHLAARLERNAMRNTNVEEIFDCLQLGIRETDFANQFNHVFMFGDFNYRVELEAPVAEKLIADKNYSQLLDYDQMTIQRRDEGIIHGFQEPPITFAPTYRMQLGSSKYMAERGNAPSYCDRVLTRSMANTWVKCTGYKSHPVVQVSEHTPVSASFIIRCVRPVMSCFSKQQAPIPGLIFQEINFVESTGPIMKKPAILISTPFTKIIKHIEAKTTQTATPYWDAAALPKLTSVSQCQEYIETCHIILMIREAAEKREDKAHRGTGLITLFGRIMGVEGVEQEFESDVMAHGRCIGKITGKFHWEGVQ